MASQFHHFHFSTHSGEEPIFSSFPLWSQKASGLSHQGQTTPAYPQFGKPCTISDNLFLFSRYNNHIGKYLERKESERDVVWWNSFPCWAKESNDNWSTMNINSKIEQKIRKWQRLKKNWDQNLHFRIRDEWIVTKCGGKKWWKANPQIWRKWNCKNDNQNGERIMAKKQI